MKRTCIAAALALAGAAHAQSSVAIFGAVDAAVTYAHTNGTGGGSRIALTSSDWNSSRLGFRGTEDLGGGLAVSFWLEGGILNESGASPSTNTNNQPTGGAGSGALVFNRRSTVGLAGRWGEVRLGRDYTPQFWNLVRFDPFSLNGVGGTQVLSSAITGPTTLRASNSVGYLLPSDLGGFFGQAMVYFGNNPQNGAATQKDGNGQGIRLGYAAGPFTIAGAASHTRYAAGDVHQNNIAASWDFSAVRLVGEYSADKKGVVNGKGHLLGAIARFGVYELHASYSGYKTDAAGNPRTDKLALGLVYNLSKRSSIYANVARLSNHGGAAQTLNLSPGTANSRSSGIDIGLSHLF